jgi:hypothetical protein
MDTIAATSGQTAVETQTLPASPLGDLPRKPRGKIASLPKARREEINRMLEDGATYKTVADHMNATHNLDLNTSNVGNWFDDGFQQYLRHREWVAEMRNLREGASDLLEPPEETLKLHQASNELAVLQIFRTLKNETLESDHVNRIRVMNALARLSREALVLKKYEDAVAKEHGMTATKSGIRNTTLSEDEAREALQDRSDDFFGLKSPARLKREWAAAGATPSIACTIGGSAGVAAEVRRQSPNNQNTQDGTAPPEPQQTAGPAGGCGRAATASIITPPSTPDRNTENGIRTTEHALPIPIEKGQGNGSSPASSETGNRREANLQPAIENSGISSLPSEIENRQSKVENEDLEEPSTLNSQPSTEPETCLYCNFPLPPLLPNGDRPIWRCMKCRTPLYAPGKKHLHCPHCASNISKIFVDGVRKSNKCPECFGKLPPYEPPDELPHAA